MADPGAEKETQASIAAPGTSAISIETASEGRNDEFDSEKAVHASEKDGDGIERVDSRSDQEEDSPKEALRATKSHATDASAATTAAVVQQPKLRWYKRLNPMRWGGIPEIPKERIVSREYQAGFFSKLTFYWMNPLMTVRL